MKKHNLYLFVLLMCIADFIHAQTMLSLQQAFEFTLQNNFSIQVAANDLEMAKTNNAIGNAGMLPSVNGVLGQDNQVMNSHQKYLSGVENNRDGAKTNQSNAGVELSWTLFNGMKMFATKSKLAELEAMGEMKLRQQMETTLTRVARAYLDVLLSKEQLKSGQEFIAISEKRLEVAKAKVSSGKSAKSEVLTAQVNLNTDIAAYKRLQTQYKNGKLGLIQLMGKEINFEFEIADSLLPDEKIKYEEVRELAVKNNSGIKMAKLNREVAMLQIREVRGERYPNLQFKSGYNYNRVQSEAGFLQSSNVNGLHYGLGLSMNIFNGFDVNRRVNNAQLFYKNTDLLVKDSLLKLDVSVSQAYNVYLTNIDLYRFEQNNLDVAKQNFEIAREQNDQGMISSNDLRIAQVNYIQNVNRLLLAAYDARLSEVELQRLSGALIK